MRPTLQEIAAHLGHIRQLPSAAGWKACVDSRELRAGDLFIALEGERQDGHAHVGAALDAGAAAVVAQPERVDEALRHNPRLLAVADSRQALLELGAMARGRHSGPLVAITGSNGKTTTKEVLAAILGGSRRVAASQGNQNSTVGAPLSLLNGLDDHEIYVMEAGMSQPGEIARLCAMARPTHGIITNIQPAHLEGTGGLDAVALEKGQLFRWLGLHNGVGIVNEDDPLVVVQAEHLRRRSAFSLRHHRVGGQTGMESLGVDEHARHLLRLSGHEVRLPVPGQAFLACAAAACALALELGLEPAAIVKELAGFRGAPGRMAVRTMAGWTLLDDSYNANPASMGAALRTLSQFQAARRVAVLGEMRELGEDSLRLHRETGRLAAELALDQVWLVGSAQACAAFAQGLADGGSCATGQAASATELAALLTPREGDAVLLKGSRLTGLDSLGRLWA